MRKKGTPVSLVAPQDPQPTLHLFWVYAVLVAVFGGLAFHHRSWKLAMFPLSFAVLGTLLFFLPNTQSSFRMSLDSSAHLIETEEFVHGSKQQEHPFALADVASAEMQYNRDATRIALILRHGDRRFPLGHFHFNNEPEQYVILTRLREDPTSGSGCQVVSTACALRRLPAER